MVRAYDCVGDQAEIVRDIDLCVMIRRRNEDNDARSSAASRHRGTHAAIMNSTAGMKIWIAHMEVGREGHQPNA